MLWIDKVHHGDRLNVMHSIPPISVRFNRTSCASFELCCVMDIK